MKRRNEKFFTGASLVCFFVMSASFPLMSLEKVEILPGLLFWCGLGLGSLAQIVLSVRRKRLVRSGGRVRGDRLGLLNFFSNSYGAAADAAMLISFAGTVIYFLLAKSQGILGYFCIAACAYSVCLHCILNGKNFRHLLWGKSEEELQKKGNRARKSRGSYEA